MRECLAEGLPVEVLPGPSAVTTALVASGLPARELALRRASCRARGASSHALLGAASETLVAFESPRRLAATLALLAELDPERPVAVCRELTKLHEEVRRGSAARAGGALRASAAPRGEVVLVCGAAQRGAAPTARRRSRRCAR